MKPSIENFLSSNDDSQISDSDKGSIKEVILTSITDDTMNLYFQILSQYLQAKRQNNLTIPGIAALSGLPEMTIKRFENLQSIPKTLTLLKILKAVGLSLTTSDLQ